MEVGFPHSHFVTTTGCQWLWGVRGGGVQLLSTLSKLVMVSGGEDALPVAAHQMPPPALVCPHPPQVILWLVTLHPAIELQSARCGEVCDSSKWCGVTVSARWQCQPQSWRPKAAAHATLWWRQP